MPIMWALFQLWNENDIAIIVFRANFEKKSAKGTTYDDS